MIRPMHQQYIVKGGGSLPDPDTYCPSNGYIDPTQPNDDWLILPKVYPKYGLLYNGYAAINANLTAIGWRVATKTDWDNLINYLGGSGVAGGKMKETGTTNWITPNTGATNESLLTTRPSGYRNYYSGVFGGIGNSATFFSGTASGDNAYYYNQSNTSVVCGWNQLLPKKEGNAIRIVKESTTLTNGQAGIYIGNDGKVYRTICINGVEWLADNLAEGKYRDGSVVPEVTDNTAWVALTTGALCAYNNDWSNV